MKTTNFITLAILASFALLCSCKSKTSEPASATDNLTDAAKETS